jgi:hypothetical protein
VNVKNTEGKTSKRKARGMKEKERMSYDIRKKKELK